MFKPKVESYNIGDTIKINDGDKLVVANRVSDQSIQYLGWDPELDNRDIATNPEFVKAANPESVAKALECTTATDWTDDPEEYDVTSENIAETIENIKKGDILKATEDIVLAEALQVPASKNFVLDLDGKTFTLSTEEHVEALVNDGDITIKNGDVTAWKVVNNGSMTVENTNFTCTAEAESGACAIKNNGTLVVNSGTFNVPFEGSTSDEGGPACIRTSGELTINGGTFTSKSKRTYCIIQSEGNITVNESDDLVINGVHGGIAVDGGNAVINGGNYASSECYGLYVSNDFATAGVTVNGGTFTGKRYSVWVGSDEKTGVEAAVAINGGTFEKQLKDQSNVSAGWGTKLYGGNFKEEPVADMIPEGYGVVFNEETQYYNVLPTNAE